MAHGEVSDRVALKDNRAKGRRMERRDEGLEKAATWGMGRAQSKKRGQSRVQSWRRSLPTFAMFRSANNDRKPGGRQRLLPTYATRQAVRVAI